MQRLNDAGYSLFSLCICCQQHFKKACHRLSDYDACIHNEGNGEEAGYKIIYHGDILAGINILPHIWGFSFEYSVSNDLSWYCHLIIE